MNGTWLRRGLMLVATAVLVTAHTGSNSTAAAEPRSFSFGDLGMASPVTLDAASPSLRVSAPMLAGFSQGAGEWASATVYLEVAGLRQHTGVAYAEANWNGHAFLGLKLKEVDSPQGRLVEWSTTDLFNGPVRGYESGERLQIPLSNFPPRSASEGGETNEVEVALRGDIGALRVTVSPESSLYVTEDGPTALKLERGSWRRSGDSLELDFEVVAAGQPTHWIEVLSRVVFSDNTTAQHTTLLDGAASGSHKVSVPVNDSAAAVSAVRVSLQYPGGAFGPASIEQWRGRWDWRNLKEAVPWAVVVLVAFPVFWVAISNAFYRPGLSAALVSVAMIGSTAVSVGARTAGGPPGAYIPVVAESERAHLTAQLQPWLQARFQEDVALARSQVWRYTSDGSPRGFVINVGLRGSEGLCAEGVPQLEQIETAVWTLLNCD